MRVGTEIFVQGVQQFGLYQVQVARRSGEKWIPTIPPLNLLVSNFRMILWPQTRRPYPPASIPCTYIDRIRLATLDERAGVFLYLSNGYKIPLICGQSDKLLRDVRCMVMPPAKISLFTSEITRMDVSKMILSLRGI